MMTKVEKCIFVIGINPQGVTQMMNYVFIPYFRIRRMLIPCVPDCVLHFGRFRIALRRKKFYRLFKKAYTNLRIGRAFGIFNRLKWIKHQPCRF